MEKKGFTLVELLAVIAILALLVILVLPNIMSLFNDVKKNSFINEVKTIYKIANQQWISDSIFDSNEKIYSKCEEDCTNPLKLSGRDDINYYIKINSLGKVTEYYVSDGTHQYSYKGVGLELNDIENVHLVSELDEDDVITITKTGIKEKIHIATFVNRNDPNSITPGDEVTISGENFYVVSSSQSETVLISKYNLYVGDIININGTGRNKTFTYVRTLDENDEGYGKQSPLATGYGVAVVPFAGTDYWDEDECAYTGLTYACSGSSKIKSKYTVNGADYYSYSKPLFVYESEMSSIAPSIVYGTAGSKSGKGVAQNNGYTIAYFVERYFNSLGINGYARLIRYEEITPFGCDEGNACNGNASWLNENRYFWMGSVFGNNLMWNFFNGYVQRDNYSQDSSFFGVRPVIVVSTSEL